MKYGTVFFMTMMALVLTVSSESAGSLSVSPDPLDFDEVVVDQSKELTLTIYNSGDDLTVTDIFVDDEHFIVEFKDEFVIPSNEEYELSVTFEPDEVREFEETLTIIINDQDNEEETVYLTGIGIDANQAPVWDDVPENIQADVMELVSFKVESSDPDDKKLSIYYSSEDLPKSAEFTDYGYGSGIFNWQTTNDDAGYYTATFTVSDDELETSVNVNITISNINQFPVINLDPDMLDFGEVSFLSSKELTFDISNVGNLDLVVSEITIDGDDFAIDVEGDITVEPEGTTTVTVTYTPSGYGSVSGEVSFVTNDPVDTELSIDLSAFCMWVGTSLFAQKKIELKKDVVINSGAVWVNTVVDRRRRGHGRGHGHGHGDLRIERDVYVSENSDLKADRVDIKRNAVIDCDITCNELRNNRGEINGEVIEGLEIPIVSEEDMLPFPDIDYNDDDVRVDRRETVELDEGTYGKIDVKRDATLVFTGGIYNIEKLKVDKSSSVLFADVSVILVKGKLETKDDVYLGPEEDAEISSRDILIYVEGARHLNREDHEDENGKAEKVKIGKGSEWRANLYTPNGKINIGKEAFIEGSIIGWEIKVDKETQIVFNGGFGTGEGIGFEVNSTGGITLEHINLTPTNFEVMAYPNPFNSSTTIRFGIPEDGKARITVYDLLGKRVTTLVKGNYNAGFHSVAWNPRLLANGKYIVRLESGKSAKTGYIVFIK